jgi:hypothetical protein
MEDAMKRSNLPSRTHRGLAGLGTLVLVAAAGLIPVASVVAVAPDMVLDWNANAVNALSNASTATPPGAGYTPPVAAIRLAMVQGAVYDAVNAIDGGHQPYLHGLPAAPASASKAAAAATAAHDVLVGFNPALPLNVRTSVDGLYTASLAGIPNDQAKTDGITIGGQVAAAMLANRVGDGQFVPYSFTAGSGVGQWRPELPAFVSDPFAWDSNVRPFTLTSTSQYRTEGPDSLTSAAYAADYNEVKAMGPATGSARTQAQTTEALFFSANPLVMENSGFRGAAAARGLSITENARLFGMTSFAGADALIDCFDNKDYWSFWRPITAIREAANDGNPATTPQTGWLPLLATPPYPDEPSGYNCYTASMMHAASGFFGTDKIAFQLASPVTGTTRAYDRFSAVPKDTIDARVWLGIHFRTADVHGAWLGKKVAQWVDKHFFEPAN